MWEYTIKCGLDNELYLEWLYNKIHNLIIKLDGQICIAKTESEQILSIAIDDKYKIKITKVLRLLLCDIFCEKMKYDYIKTNWRNSSDNSFLEVLISVCTYFDIELERRIFIQNFILSSSIMLDTYLDFCMPSLKQKWNDLVNLVNNNADVFFQDENFFEILAFLVLNLNVKVESVILKLTQEDNIVLVWDKFYLVYNKNDIIGIVEKLIELSPKQIVVTVPKQNDFVVNRIVQLFGTRVKLSV